MFTSVRSLGLAAIRTRTEAGRRLGAAGLELVLSRAEVPCIWADADPPSKVPQPAPRTLKGTADGKVWGSDGL
jgi:hypothetical protein